MEREEMLKGTDHYRCRLCGQLSPLSSIQCENPGCRAQLHIYGMVVSGGTSPAPAQKPAAQPAVSQPAVQKPVEEAYREKKKIHKERPQLQPQPQLQPVPVPRERVEKSFLQKKTLLIWLDILFFLAYAVVTGSVAAVEGDGLGAEVTFWTFLGLLLTALAVFLAQSGRHIWHSLFRMAFGAGVLGVYAEFLIPPDYFIPVIMVLLCGEFLLGLLSLVGVFRKSPRSAAGERLPKPPVFLKKRTVLLVLDVIILGVTCVLIYFKSELINDLVGYWGPMVMPSHYVACGVQLVVFVLVLFLLLQKQYVLHGIVLLCNGVGLTVLQWSMVPMMLAVGAVILMLNGFGGILSFLKEE